MAKSMATTEIHWRCLIGIIAQIGTIQICSKYPTPVDLYILITCSSSKLELNIVDWFTCIIHLTWLCWTPVLQGFKRGRRHLWAWWLLKMTEWPARPLDAQLSFWIIDRLSLWTMGIILPPDCSSVVLFLWRLRRYPFQSLKVLLIIILPLVVHY